MTTLPGFRLSRLEVFNWGTFGGAVWGIDAAGANTLLTGDIGSGKSTLVDAITTLLVAPQRLAYNRAAGADARERSLRSYVLGYYKSERGESGGTARAVPLRDRNTYSVVLGRFESEGFDHPVTLAQVFWMKEPDGQPDRFYVVADAALSIKEHFGGFGPDIHQLKKRLRKAGHEVADSFVAYGAAFRRRFGIDSEQAMDLFHQTVSMKSVGNLTEFVRQHMLEPFPVEERIQALVGHFDDLTRAHEAVLKAKAQIEALAPLVADCDRHAELAKIAGELRACRDALRAWFARRKGALLDRRLATLSGELARLEDRAAALEEERSRRHGDRDDVKRAIADSGGDRLDSLRAEMRRLERDVGERQHRAERYDALARALGLAAAHDGECFVANQRAIATLRDASESERADAQNALADVKVEMRDLRRAHDELVSELASLRSRRSNVPARMLALRARLCDGLGVSEDALPFAGELLRVREGEEAWEGAIERVLHNFGLSMLVPDALYGSVAQWVERTHLDARLVYYRVRPQRAQDRAAIGPRSLVHKLDVKESDFWGWLEAEVAKRFDYACCETLEELRRETRAITRAGQTKGGGERHEKDDRHRIDDRSRYVLGWTNEAKIAALHKDRRDLETRIQRLAERFANVQKVEAELVARLGHLGQMTEYQTFREIEWRPLAVQIDELQRELASLEGRSDKLRVLSERLREIEAALAEIDGRLGEVNGEIGGVRVKHDAATKARLDCETVLEAATQAGLGGAELDRLEPLVLEALGGRELTVESCDNREKDVRELLQARIDAEDAKMRRLAERIVQAMQSYRDGYPLETRETDASLAAAGEYRGMLERLKADDLPRFEARFKELLNENTIREIAGFQSQLNRERQEIKERVETINRSLAGIDYNPGRFIVLEPDPTTDAEIREFQQDLRACTEGALTGSEEDAYSEGKFFQVKRIIERFRGRQGTGELDARWTRKVTDVRNWFVFSASERWRETGTEHEHYTDSGGKSGGQKEKLAYTVLAASLAYQFGLEATSARSRTFRFVVIDEAFGRGSDESTRYGLELFARLGLQLLVVTPLQKIRVIEPYVASVGYVHNDDGRRSMIRNLTIEEYRAEQAARTG